MAGKDYKDGFADHFHERHERHARRLDDVYHPSVTPEQRSLEKANQGNEFTRISHRSEGRCYNCADNDVVQSTLVDACYGCIGRRGEWKDSALLTFCMEKAELYCMFCGKWRLGGANFNCNICLKCMPKISKRASEYSKGGKQYSNPFYNWLKRKQGKDWRILEFNELRPSRR